jgi:undecaprenyl-diphosphatase
MSERWLRSAPQRPEWDAATVAVGLAVLGASAALARAPLSRTEVRVFRVANGLPEALSLFIRAPMQYGTVGTVPLLATVALLRRRPRSAASIAMAGTGAWLLVKAAKPLANRARPPALVGDVRIRGNEKGDRGFPSGHAAVSAALTVVLAPYGSPRARAALTGLAALVPFARMYVGAHLPLDCVGGSALGVAIGSAVNAALLRREALHGVRL